MYWLLEHLYSWIVLYLCLTITIATTIRTWLRLRQIPGPFLAAFSNLWLLWHSTNGHQCYTLAELAKKYGSNQVIISDLSVWKRISGVRTGYRRSSWFDAGRFHPKYNNIESDFPGNQTDTKLHDALKAKIGLGYSRKENERLEQSIDTCVASFIRLLENKYLSTDELYNPVNFASKSGYFILDVISELTFGKTFGYLAGDEDCYELLETIQGNVNVVQTISVLPWVGHLLRSWAFRKLLPSEKDLTGLGRQKVAERFKRSATQQKDIIGSFIRHGLSQGEIETEVLFTIALQAILLYILSSPQVYAKLLSETSSIFMSTPITDSEARNMPYFQVVIKEGLRIHPAADPLGFRVVPEGGDTINGLFLPANTLIGYNFLGLIRDPKLWGDDVDLFRPERWLASMEPKRLREMEANVDLVFGYGKWHCLGRNLALVEINKVLIELLRRFDLSIVNPLQPWTEFNATAHVTSNMWLRIKKREEML
ncbi:benzoate 4-monooxygenase cytochrome P450 [Stipitochalara longipes BDJ]|nr:benzoate 4-monooxygenase cytochrome P450 [Stipitochalara longipes BDJ]